MLHQLLLEATATAMVTALQEPATVMGPAGLEVDEGAGEAVVYLSHRPIAPACDVKCRVSQIHRCVGSTILWLPVVTRPDLKH